MKKSELHQLKTSINVELNFLKRGTNSDFSDEVLTKLLQDLVKIKEEVKQQQVHELESKLTELKTSNS